MGQEDEKGGRAASVNHAWAFDGLWLRLMRCY